VTGDVQAVNATLCQLHFLAISEKVLPSKALGCIPVLVALIKRSGAFLSILILACSVIPAAGAAQQPMTFTGYPPSQPGMEGTSWFIFGNGIINAGTDARLESFIKNSHIPHPSILYLNSDGGNLVEGMKLGRMIRKNDLFTYVGQEGSKEFETLPGGCYSSCALAFLGGTYRFYHRGSEYGVHRFYSSIPSGIDSDEAQIISAAIVGYIREMRVDPSLFTFMTQAGADEIKLLTQADQVRLGVANNGIGPTNWTMESHEGVIYLKGARETWRGMNKFLILCAGKSGLILQIFYSAERRGDVILKYFHVHRLTLNGGLIPSDVIPIQNLLYGQATLNDADVIGAAYKLTPQLINRISHAKSVGVQMQPSDTSPIFMGFSDMDFTDGARQLPGLINACH
jgi:hypothetical protein